MLVIMNNQNYTANDIETLNFRDAIRTRIEMYMGSADNQGVLQCIREIASNCLDEAIMGYGKNITIELYEENKVTISDEGRGCPFGKREDGTEALEAIYMTPHSGGKFSKKTYQSVIGMNGIGGKGVALSSDFFQVDSYRNGEQATLILEKGIKKDFFLKTNTTHCAGTVVTFIPSQEVYKIEKININFEDIKEMCRNWSYLNKGIVFNLKNHITQETISFSSENGLQDLVADNVTTPVHPTPLYFELEDENEKVEVALQWTKGKEKSFVFTNGLHNSEGGTPLTGMKTAITTFMKKQFKGGFDGDMARTGLVFAVACKTPNPSFANQTKTKINNPSLRGLAQRATGAALSAFQEQYPDEFKAIIDFLAKEKKAEQAAERARENVLKATKDIADNQKKKVFASDKLKNAEFLGQDSVLLLVEGNSAAASMAMARDVKKYGILSLRGKVINCLANPDEKIFENEEIKLLLSAMNIVPGKYNASKLRYGKIAICTDADSDGYHIGLLIMSALRYLCPEFLEEGRLCWLRSPLYIVKSGKTESFYFTDEEFEKNKHLIKGEITRAKGLGALSPEQAQKSMFTEQYQRMDTLIPDAESIFLLEQLMGSSVAPRRDFIFNNVDFSEIKE